MFQNVKSYSSRIIINHSYKKESPHELTLLLDTKDLSEHTQKVYLNDVCSLKT